MRARVSLVTVDDRILSSYTHAGSTDPGVPEYDLRTLASTGGGLLTPDAALALLVLAQAVKDAGGSFRITDAYRPIAMQAKARRRYEDTGGPYVARPGYSYHGAGRAVDVHVEALGLPWDTYVGLVVATGWRLLDSVTGPTDTEAWHIEYLGPWQDLEEAEGYAVGAVAATLDIGEGVDIYPHAGARQVQSQLRRLGFDCGAVDGLIGPRTKQALIKSGYTGLWWDAPSYLFTLPTKRPTYPAFTSIKFSCSPK